MGWLKNIFKKNQEGDGIVKITNSGRAYIEWDDFWKQPEIIEQVKRLSESNLIKDIDKRNNLVTEDRRKSSNGV